MKLSKIIKTILLFTLILSFTACSKSEFVNIASFVDMFNLDKDFYTLQYSNFAIDDSDEKTQFITQFPIDESSDKFLTLILIENENLEIEQCRLSIAKFDKSSKKIELSTNQTSTFFIAARKIIESFCLFSEVQSNEILDEFMLSKNETYKQNGQLSKRIGNFEFVYLSNDIASEFIIYNMWLTPEFETQKPISKSPFDSTINIRDDTVAHK